MKIIYFIVLILVNRLKGACIKETNEKQPASERYEKTDSLSEAVVPLERKADDFEDHQEVDKISINEKNASEEGKKASSPEETDITERSDKSSEDVSNKNAEKQFEELSEISKSTTEDEERMAGDVSEASAESKYSDIENVSSKIDESGRSSGSEKYEIDENNDELNPNEILATRRMLSNSDLTIDIKARSDSTSSDVTPDMKIATNLDTNTYNIFNEFESRSGSNFMSTTPNPNQNSVKKGNEFKTTPTPVVRVTSSHENFKKQSLPKFYPEPELNINFPHIHTQFRGTTDVPIYLELKHTQIIPNDRMSEDHGSQISVDKNQAKPLEPSSQQQFRQAQSIMSVEDKKNENPVYESRNRIKFNQNQGRLESKGFLQNTPVSNSNYRAENQQIQNQERYIDNQSKEPRRQVETLFKNQGIYSQAAVKNKNFNNFSYEPKNEAYELQQTREKLNLNLFSKNKQLENLSFERIATPYSYKPHYNPTVSSNAPLSNFDPNSQTFNTLFSKLAEATKYSKKLPTNLVSPQYIQTNPYVFPFIVSPYSYNLSYLPGFQNVF